MSKIPSDVIQSAVNAVLQGSTEKKRNFLEAIELQVGLKDYDTQRDKRFAGTIVLPNCVAPNRKILVFGDAQHCEEAKCCGIPHLSVEEMDFKKTPKLVKKLAKQHHGFLASQVLIPQIPRLMGPGLNKAGKFPTVLLHGEKILDKIASLRASVKFQLKKVLCMGVVIGNVGMTESEVVANLSTAINFLVSLLKKSWNNIKTLHIKSSMGKPQRIYG